MVLSFGCRCFRDSLVGGSVGGTDFVFLVRNSATEFPISNCHIFRGYFSATYRDWIDFERGYTRDLHYFDFVYSVLAQKKIPPLLVNMCSIFSSDACGTL